MNEEIGPEDRAGWWRRTGALCVDGMFVIIPSATIGALLFASTAGFLQWNEPGVEWQVCSHVTSVPATLSPPPPANSNDAAVCQIYSIAGQIARTLTVSRTVPEGDNVSSLSQTYALRSSGESDGWDLSWITWVALLILLIVGEWRMGTTPGKRLLGLRVVAEQEPNRLAVPLRQIVTRYIIAIGGGALPVAVLLAYTLVPIALGGSPLPLVPAVTSVCLLLSAAWQIWNLVRIVRRRPAIYDYIARVEVIRMGGRGASSETTPVQV